MTRSLLVHREARLDVEEAALTYETEVVGLGARFLDELDHLFGRISEAPRQFPIIDEPVRRGLMRRFSYGAYFVYEGDIVQVVAVLHLSRRPGGWLGRVEDV